MKKILISLVCCTILFSHCGNYELPCSYLVDTFSLFENNLFTKEDDTCIVNPEINSSLLPAIPIRQKDVTITYNSLHEGSISNVQLHEPYCALAAWCNKTRITTSLTSLTNELAWACIKPELSYAERRIKIAKALVCGADPKDINIPYKGSHPLAIALKYNDRALAQLVLDNGGLLSNEDAHRPTLSFAKTGAMAQLLKNNGALDKYTSDFYHQYLYTLMQPGYAPDLVSFFVDNGFPVHARNHYHYTPLMRLMVQALYYEGQESSLLQKAKSLLKKYRPEQIEHTISKRNPAFRKLAKHTATNAQKVLLHYLLDVLSDTLAAHTPYDEIYRLAHKKNGLIASRSNSRYTFVQ